ncbi:hypothetical protein MSL71_4700 [Desulfoluna butyratoxydans]|uniref:Uncharacterized protein n=1 Tax=Desulfoluna butyratoxydans TaxID=231438 RepID=A0A4U8YIP9_9BACT|nr:hypothetical protein MSL71_4700 [Desulfoluna butyratoxydans]
MTQPCELFPPNPDVPTKPFLNVLFVTVDKTFIPS